VFLEHEIDHPNKEFENANEFLDVFFNSNASPSEETKQDFENLLGVQGWRKCAFCLPDIQALYE